MKTAIVFVSQHHGNTEKIAKEMASALNARLFKLAEAKPGDLKGFDLVGFGSGVYGFDLHKGLFSFVEGFPSQANKKAFVFSTSGAGKQEYNKKFCEALSGKGFRVLGDFACRGFITWGPFKLTGGGSKGHPNQEDLANARAFAEAFKQA